MRSVTSLRLIVANLFLTCTCVLHMAAAYAQSALPTNAITPEHDYASSAIDSVDLDSGNVILDIRIITYKQRGSLPDFTLKALWNRYQEMLHARLKQARKNISGEPNSSKDAPQ